METCHPLHLGVTDKFRNSLHPHFITWSTVYISTIFQLDEITKCPYTLKNDQRRSEKWSHWIIISPKNKCLSLALCRCIVAYIYDPGRIRTSGGESANFGCSKLKIRENTWKPAPENAHARAFVASLWWGVFGCRFSGVLKSKFPSLGCRKFNFWPPAKKHPKLRQNSWKS